MDEINRWRPDEYLQFEKERTQPCRDLAGRIDAFPRTIIDLGCGPGNSTAVLAERWPDASITGLDSSESMLRSAAASGVPARWVQSDIASWAAGAESQFDLVFSNAALQWVDSHDVLFPLLMSHVAEGGLLAIQVPADIHAPAHRIMRERFPGPPVREWFVHEPGFYYDVLTPLSRQVQLWTTEYIHILPGVEAIADWYRSTGLRPFLQALSNDSERQRFLEEYIEGLRAEFRPQIDGRVLFPFRRLFVLAAK